MYNTRKKRKEKRSGDPQGDHLGSRGLDERIMWQRCVTMHLHRFSIELELTNRTRDCELDPYDLGQSLVSVSYQHRNENSLKEEIILPAKRLRSCTRRTLRQEIIKCYQF